VARIAGVDLPMQKRIEIALTYIYGIGHPLAHTILDAAGVDTSVKVKDLTEAQIASIREALRPYKVEGDLRKEITQNIKRLIDIGTYRGSRHRKGLPARGQRTRTNARTKRGKRRTVGSGRRKLDKT